LPAPSGPWHAAEGPAITTADRGRRARAGSPGRPMEVFRRRLRSIWLKGLPVPVGGRDRRKEGPRLGRLRVRYPDRHSIHHRPYGP
jgi:hypothetical protein